MVLYSVELLSNIVTMVLKVNGSLGRVMCRESQRVFFALGEGIWNSKFGVPHIVIMPKDKRQYHLVS